MGRENISHSKIKDWIAFFSLALAVFITGKEIFKTYFQGDEWYFFATYLPYTKHWYGVFQVIFNFFTKIGPLSTEGHLTPLAHSTFVLLLQLFGTSFTPWAVTSLIVQTINSFLLYKLVQKIVPNNKVLAYLAGLIFALSGIPIEAVVWVMTFPWTTLAVTYLLLASLQFFDILSGKDSISSKVKLCFFCLCALLSKESSVILFPVFFILWLFYRSKSNWKVFKWLVPLGMLFSFYRLVLPLVLTKIQKTTSPIVSTEIFAPELVLFRLFIYPIKVIEQVFISNEFVKSIAEYLTPLAYPTYGAEKATFGKDYVIFTQSAGSDMIIYFFSLLIIFIFYLAYRELKKDPNLRKALIFSFSIIIFSSFPLLLITTYAPWHGYATFFDGRHLYLPTVGAATFLAIIFFQGSLYMSRWGKHTRFLKKYDYRAYLFLILVFWTVGSFQAAKKYIDLQSGIGTDRKKIINFITKTVPNLPEKAVFYIDSNNAYYGYGELMPPFQINFGQTLAVVYYQRDELPIEYLDWDLFANKAMTYQDYVERSGRGFGYYLNKIKLMKALEVKKLKPENVFAFRWDGDKHEISDATHRYREQVQEMQARRQVFEGWARYGSTEHMITFAVPPSYEVRTSENLYTVFDKNKLVFSLSVYSNDLNETVESFVGKQVIDGKAIGTDFTLKPLIADLAIPRNVLIPVNSTNQFYTFSGNGKRFYKFEIFDNSQTDLIFRTIEIID